jgi:hypothetical protein
LITGSTASSQAIPAAPLSKSIQQNSSSLVEHVGYRGYRGFRGYRRVGVYRGYRRVGLYRGYRRAGIYGYRGTAVSAFIGYRLWLLPGYRLPGGSAPSPGLPASRLLWLPRLPACRLIPRLPLGRGWLPRPPVVKPSARQRMTEAFAG